MNLKDKIYTIRGKQVMLDRDLAELYGVETRIINQAVKRNIERFPEDFCFQLTQREFEEYKQDWISQFVIPNSQKMGLRIKPRVFTEHGVTALAGVLKNKKAIELNIKIIKTFVQMRHFLQENASVFQRLDRVELKQLEHDKHFNQIFKAIEQKQLTPTQGIFYDGQLFDVIEMIFLGHKKTLFFSCSYFHC